MAKDFLLLAAFRSGSTWLVDILNHVHGTAAYGELFAVSEKKAGTEELTRDQSQKTTQYLEQTIRAYPLYYRETEQRRIRPFSTFSYLRSFYQQDGTTGFKLMYTQLAQHPEIWAYIRLYGISVLHLVRQNHLDVIVSREMRKATRTTHRVVGAENVTPVQITLHAESLTSQMRSLQGNIEMARRLIKLSRVRSLELVYEELSRDKSRFDPLWSFLQINPQNQEPQSQLEKIVKAGYAQTIANYDEVCDTLSGTEFAHLIGG
ncbi:MAG: hypothetical protein R3293_10105 [Candidatus Promineifilaceae bacterium]|nr:hypothetical protein [Candidatus Promineifilaceae bacterium]